MSRKIGCIVFIVSVFVLAMTGTAQDKGKNKYVGVSTCAPCHKSASKGNQMEVWQKSKHAAAYTVLTTPKADEIAKAKGLKKPAAESPECLTCHVTTTDATLMEKTFDMKMGNQCETCHGAGSAYKSMPVMKDKAKAYAAGLTEYKDDAAIEAKCKTCHNEKSPSYKPFVFKDMWPKIKHAAPKG